MAKKDAPVEETGLATVPASEEVDFGGLASLMQQYGITAADVTAPIPLTPTKQNFEQLATLRDEIFDSNGNPYERVNGHTGPLMFLAKKGEYDGDKFSGYDGFYVYAIAVPGKGEFVVTISRPTGEAKPAVVALLDTLNPGQLFQVASFATSSGFKVFNPVPVQANGKLLK